MLKRFFKRLIFTLLVIPGMLLAPVAWLFGLPMYDYLFALLEWANEP